LILPIADDNRDRRITPWVNYALIAVNILVFAALQRFGANDSFTFSYSAVPAEIVSGEDIVTEDLVVKDPASGSTFLVPGLGPTPLTVYITLITSMFMHGGIAHLLGNMLFLFIFGDNLEDRLGRVRYLLFYLVCGILASLAHVYSTLLLGGDMYIPSLGASGAISGVLGGYLVLFPRKRVHVIFIRFLMRVPAVVAIGIWFVFQFISGIGLLGAASQSGGVAYAAHIGGFLFGCLLILFFSIGTKPPDRTFRDPKRRIL
jgi:membrane associated rhomboid family serine protease